MIVLVMFLLLYAPYSNGVANLKHYETLSYIDVKTNIKRAIDGSKSLIKQLRFQVFHREFDLTLKPKTSLMADGFRVHLIHGDGSVSHAPFVSNQIFAGHLTGRPDVRVHAHMEERLWSVQIFDNSDTYSIEPAWRLLTPAENPKNDTLIAYRASDMTSDSFNSSGFCGVHKHHHTSANEEGSLTSEKSPFRSGQDLTNYAGRKKGAAGRDKRKTGHVSCSLYLVGDYSFFTGRCRGNYVTCTSIMFSYVENAGSIFTSSVFKGRHGENYKGILLEIGQIFLYTTYTERMTEYPHSHFNENKHWTVDDKLDSFSLYVGYMTHGKAFCAHHLFTDNPFPNRILGLAWMGSICSGYGSSRPGVSKANSGVSSGADINQGFLPTLQMTLVFAHELGHSFGSEHDPNTAECAPQDIEGGRFLMWAASVSGSRPNNLKFSPCSLKLIGQYLHDNECFKRMSLVPSFCGNGVVEELEACDAGVHGVINTDNCCSSQCEFKNNSSCSEKNKECCHKCSMSLANTQCSSTNSAECKAASYCTGASFDCPDPLPLPDWTPCRSHGQCHRGKCLNYCEVKAIKDSLILRECLCQSNVGNAACKLCCFDLADPRNPGPCTVYSNITLRDGTPCYLGQCGRGVCLEPTASHIRRLYSYLSYIQDSTLEAFMKANIVLMVVMLSLVLCLPSVYLISRADRKIAMAWKRQKSIMMARKSMATEEVRAYMAWKRERLMRAEEDSTVSASEEAFLAWKREQSMMDALDSIDTETPDESEKVGETSVDETSVDKMK